VDDDLWIDDGLEELVMGVPGDFGAPAAVFVGSYPSLAAKKKKLQFAESPWKQHRALDLARVHQAQERERQGHIAAVRDMNLQKAQVALQEKRDRDERINRERLRNLEKARKAKLQ
jgi:hypothetical protein